jgi:hypothetical protein
LQLLLRLDKITLVWPDPERTAHGPSVNFPKPEAERSVQLFVMPDIGRMLELKRMMKVLKCTQRSASVLLFVTGLVGASIPASDLSAQEKIKLRDALVRSRVALINSIRFTLKSLGHTISNPSSQRFHKTVMAEVPQECRLVIAPVVRALEELSQRIKELDASLAKLAAERYPQTIYLQQVSESGPDHSTLFCAEDWGSQPV